MASAEPMPARESEPAERKGRPRLMLVLAGCCLLAGLLGRQIIYYASAQPSDHTPPPDRHRLNAPFITSPDAVVDKMVELAELDADDLVYDLGCGDGRIVITAALQSGCRGVGFDINPERVAEARDNARIHAVEGRVEILEQDVFTVDLSEADVAMMYLLDWMMNKLLPQFEQMKPGARIVAHDFWIDGVEPDQIVQIEIREGDTHDVYLYTTPLKKNPHMEKGRPPRPDNIPPR